MLSMYHYSITCFNSDCLFIPILILHHFTHRDTVLFYLILFFHIPTLVGFTFTQLPHPSLFQSMEQVVQFWSAGLSRRNQVGASMLLWARRSHYFTSIQTQTVKKPDQSRDYLQTMIESTTSLVSTYHYTLYRTISFEIMTDLNDKPVAVKGALSQFGVTAQQFAIL